MAQSAYYELADSMPNSTEYAKISWKWPEFCLDMAHSTYYIMYPMRAIIIRGLYIFYPLFEGQKRFFKEVFFRKFCLYVWLVFKSGL